MPDLPALFDVLLLAAMVAVVAGGAVVVLAVSAGLNPEKVVRRRGPVGALVLILLAALLITLYSSSRDVDRGGRDSTEVAPPPPAAEGAPEKESSRGLGWVLSAVVVAAIAGGSVAAWRVARAHVPEQAHEAELERRLLAELDAAIDDLERIDDPRTAVIACYGRLRELAAASGIPVRRSDTALELFDTLAERVPALAPASARLVALFQEARFSSHLIDDDMRRAALDALGAARDRLVAPV